jgi:hypothetical protein
MTFGVFLNLIFMRGTWCDKEVLVARSAYIKTGFFCRFQPRATKTGLVFPSSVDFENSLFHPVCRFVGFPVLVHTLTYME